MQTLRDRLAAGPFELILSSGFFGFFAHTGVARALEETGLRPALVGGSSAGALVAGLWGAGLAADAIRERLFALRREDFWDPDPWFALRGGLLRGARFERLLEEALRPVGVARIEDCRTPVRVVAFDLAQRRTTTLVQGALAPAICASCCVPFMFQPVRIEQRPYLDGGIADRAGLSAASPDARVLHHHLPATSPWRRLTPRQSRPPVRANLHVLCEPSLPRVSPLHLHRGPRAYALARNMALRALESAS